MQKYVLDRNFYLWPKSSVNVSKGKGLSQQFALVGFVMLPGGMVTIGAWVAEKIGTPESSKCKFVFTIHLIQCHHSQ